MINHTVSLLEQTGGRRGALMFCLDRDHADVGEFLDFKAKDGDIAHANISVNYNTSVREWLRNKDQVFEQIVERACQNGEPGILNGHLANEENNIWYYRKLISTNPCGEIWLEPYGCCCLGHLVLLNLMSNKAEGYSWDHEKLRQTIYLAVRFLDNVLTVSQYPLPELAENCQKVRRIGLGVTGLAHALILRDLEYTKSVDEVRGLMREIMDDAYGASISLAMEKGPFQRFDKKLLASGFAQRLPAHTRKAIEERGLRNCAILTVAPTGTISTMLDVSPGIEPIMGRSYSRIWRDGDQWTRVQCRDPFWDEHMNTNEPEPVDNSPLFRTATEMRIEDHLAMQTTVQEFVDNAVSKTVNIPQGLMPGEVAERIAYYLPYLKGLTLFPAGSREASPFEEDPTCPTGACEV
jgi:ribonucleoside-diphosphate reductase alpha chain